MAIATREPAQPPVSVEPSAVFTINIPFLVYPQGARWYAASTEYLVMGEGASEDEAVRAFVGAASGYVASALAHGWIDALTRRPPIGRRMEIRRRYWVARILGRRPASKRQPLSFDWSSLRLA